MPRIGTDAGGWGLSSGPSRRLPGRLEVLAVIDVAGNVVPGVDALEDAEQRGVVGLELIRRLHPRVRRPIVELDVRPEPPLRAFSEVLGDRVDGVFVLPVRVLV